MKRIILGTAQFGLNYGINNPSGRPSEFEVFELLDYSYNHGLKTLDTADAYGYAAEILGIYNIQKPGRFFFNTKFLADSSNLISQLDKSLIKLNQESVNVYLYHSFGDFVNYPEIKGQLLDLKKQGRINKIGISVYENEEFEKACESDLIDVIQFPYNLLDNYSQRGDHIKLAKTNRKELQVRSIFLQGLFFKQIAELPNLLIPLTSYLKKIHEIAQKANISIAQLAMNYALQQNEIDYILFGVDSLKQLRDNIDISKNIISDDIIEEINKIDVKEIELLYPKNWK